MALDLADGLAYAHGQGIIHRDIKPANILLSGSHAQIADFGLGRALAASGPSDVSSGSLAVGTPAYMSPEQSVADARVDQRSDLYSLGCVLYEMLGGQPPFQGPSAQAILNRHRVESVPPLEVIRTTLSPALCGIVSRLLAKSPADRFASADEAAAALREVAAGKETRSDPRASSRRFGLAFAVGGIALILMIRYWPFSRGPALDRNRVVIFPLSDPGAPAGNENAGADAAIMIGRALENTEPLQSFYGWTWLEPAARRDIRTLTDETARQIARGRGARFYLDGSVVRGRDSAIVTLRLHDAGADSLLPQVSVSGVLNREELPQLGLRAMARLLELLVQPGRIDQAALRALAARPPAAIANWLQGERLYRRSQFDSALIHLRRSVEGDSSLAIAAILGAETAEWEEQHEEARVLVDVALRAPQLLPAKYVAYARGLASFFAGDADSAVAQFKRALAVDSTWSGAWTALAETYTQLLPDVSNLDSLAAAGYEAAYRYDPSYAPALFNIVRLAVRDGRIRQARTLLADYRKIHSGWRWNLQLGLMIDCVDGKRVDWRSAVDSHPEEVAHAGRALALGGAHLECAKEAFRAALDSSAARLPVRWDSFLGLEAVLMAQKHWDQARFLIDSVVPSQPAAQFLYVIGAAAGGPMKEPARMAVAGIGDPANAPWVVGLEAQLRGDRNLLTRSATLLANRADSTRDPMDRSLADGMAARVALAAGDTTTALRRLGAIRTAAVPVGADTLTCIRCS